MSDGALRLSLNEKELLLFALGLVADNYQAITFIQNPDDPTPPSAEDFRQVLAKVRRADVFNAIPMAAAPNDDRQLFLALLAERRVCPYCKGTDFYHKELVRDGAVHTELLHMRCEGCGREWQEQLRLVHAFALGHTCG